MANGQFLTVENGKDVLKQAPSVSTGAAQGNSLVQTDATGKIDISFLPNGIGADTVSKLAGEALSAGDFVGINAAGEIVRADNTVPRRAIGFVDASYVAGDTVTVFAEGNNANLSSLTPGAEYCLAATGGVVLCSSVTPVDGEIIQELGTACDATTLVLEQGRCILVDIA